MNVWDLFGWVAAALMTTIGVMIVHGTYTDYQNRDWFLAECSKDYKDYECYARWRDKD